MPVAGSQGGHQERDSVEICYLKSNWEAKHLGLTEFLDRARADGFDGSELYLPILDASPDEVRRLHEERDMRLVVQLKANGHTPAEHAAAFSAAFERAAEAQPLLVNAHLGSDLFSFEENLDLYQRAIETAGALGVPVAFETHRGRPTFAAPATRRYLEALPGMHLTADFSHWTVVHESLLENQRETMQLAIDRSAYIHARVGHPQGPQVAHPEAPEWQRHVQAHMSWWRRIVTLRRDEGRPFLAITPEFGPPPYMPTLPFLDRAIVDPWDANVAMRRILERAFASADGSDALGGIASE